MRLRDAIPAGSAYLELTKPRITGSVVFTAAAGLWLAPVRVPASLVLLTLAGTALVVAAANVLNMFLERDSDALMPRTSRRPLPSGRIEPSRALLFGLLLASASIPLLTFGGGPIPAALAAIALVSYVLLYTPMKRRTAAALLVGAVAGATPPLIGWTAATGGEREARRNIVLYTVALIAVSLMFIPLGVSGRVYLVAAVASGALFLALGVQGLRSSRSERWARNEFFGSLAYLAVLLAALLLDRPPVL
jgi:protoheme IX farnesyltransferase